MVKNNVRFFSLKFVIMVIVNIIFVILSAGLEGIFGEVQISSFTDAQNTVATKTLLSAVVCILFFVYVFFITSRIKHSTIEDKQFSSIVKFALKETVVYILYLIIIYILIAAIGESSLSESFARYICMPHIIFFQMGLNIILNLLLMSLIYFTISVIARSVGVRKPILEPKLVESNTQDDEDDEQKTEDDQN